MKLKTKPVSRINDGFDRGLDDSAARQAQQDVVADFVFGQG
jgi:hypothetical protein